MDRHLLEEAGIVPTKKPSNPKPRNNKPVKDAVSRAGLGEEAQVYNLSDLGNAQRFVTWHGRNLRYCVPWRKWLIHDGQRWQKDDTGEVYNLAIKTIRGIYEEASLAITRELREELSRHALRSESAPKIKAMLELAQYLPGVPVRPEELDQDIWLLNVQNGTIDLRTGELRRHRQEDMITKLAPVEFDPSAECPLWNAFLDRVLDRNTNLISFIQLAVGYSLTGITKEQVMFILHGEGMNGKSTLLGIISELMGDYAMSTPSETLMIKPDGQIRNDVARLRGARMVTSSESEQNQKLAESLIKAMTGGIDIITARFLYGEEFEYVPEFKLFLGTNHRPRIKGTDHAIWRRLRLIPFNVRISEEERDNDLPVKLRAEFAGILNWCLEGCLAWQQAGLTPPEEVKVATDGYRAEMDVLAGFLEECCIVKDYAKVNSTKLYDVYLEWCKQNGEKAASLRVLAQKLQERGFVNKSGTGGYKFWHGIGIRELTVDIS
ncbi:MAG: DNA primase family protein [Bacillota bacterium]